MKNNKIYNVLVTGASRGIGLELVRQFAQDGVYSAKDCRVIATCRDPENADELKSLTNASQNIVVKQLDVTDSSSIDALKCSLAQEPIDILINNAGAYGPNAPLLAVDIESWHKIFDLNCVAPVHLSQKLFDNICQSELKKIITVSSDMGSIAMNRGGGAYLYRSSKAGLNAAMYSLSLDVQQFGVTVAMLHPGHVKTDMGGRNAKVSALESVSGLRKVISELTQEQSGGFMNWKGEPMPW